MKPKILIIDDSDYDIQLAKHMLRKSGYDIHSTENPAQGVNLAVTLKPDVMLIDIQMPHLSGFDVLAEIKSRKVQTRVIMWSGVFLDLDTAIRCIRSGAVDFLPKAGGDLAPRIERTLILDNPQQLQSGPSELVRQLILQSDDQSNRLRELEKTNEALRRKNIKAEIAVKSLAVILAFAPLAVFQKFFISLSPVVLVTTFVCLMSILLIPLDRLHNVSAAWRSAKAKIALK